VEDRHAWVRAPQTWVVEARDHVGPFITREVYRLPDGSERIWNSRAHRKAGGLGRALGRPMAVLFMIGSALFALGSFPLYATAVDPRIVGVTFFTGSVFFTSAGYLQFLQVINAPGQLDAASSSGFRSWAWEPGRIDWWAAAVQSLGTLLFNISTFAAMHTAFTVTQQNRRIWAPDLFGSVAFLIASSLAWTEVCHGWWRVRPRDISWWIVALNLGGSIAFQVSAIAAFVRPATGTLADAALANMGTFVGAVGFFVGALLLFPEMHHASDVDPAAGASTDRPPTDRR
jgi:YrhK-like protein